MDLDGDGDTDVVTAANASDQFAWYENDGSSPPGWISHVIDSGTTNADGAHQINVVDLDGDGDTDVVTAARNSDQFAWYENDGSTPPAGFCTSSTPARPTPMKPTTSTRWTSTATATPTW